MNNLQRDKRRSRAWKADLEYLDGRIVPSAVHPTLTIVADGASVHSQQPSLNLIVAESASPVRHEQRIEKPEERREAALERREMRASRLAALYAARHHITLAGPVQDQVIPAASTSSTPATTALGTSGSGQGTTGSGQGTTGSVRARLGRLRPVPPQGRVRGPRADSCRRHR